MRSRRADREAVLFSDKTSSVTSAPPFAAETEGCRKRRRGCHRTFCRRSGSAERMSFTGERVLAGKAGALRNVFSNGWRSDAVAPESQKLFSCRSCPLVGDVLQREPLPTD